MSNEILLALIAFIGGGTFSTAVAWVITWRVRKRKAGIDEVGDFDKIIAKVKDNFAQQIRQESEKQGLKTEIRARDLIIEQKDAIIGRHEDMISQILIDHGEIKGREALCNERLTALEKKDRERDDQMRMLQTIHERYTMAAAELKKLKNEGKWNGDPDLTKVV